MPLRMSLEDFLFEYLSNFMEFDPNPQLKDAIRGYVFQGKASDIKPFDGISNFKKLCDEGTDFYLKHHIGELEIQ